MSYEWYAKIDKVTFRVLNDFFFFDKQGANVLRLHKK